MRRHSRSSQRSGGTELVKPEQAVFVVSKLKESQQVALFGWHFRRASESVCIVVVCCVSFLVRSLQATSRVRVSSQWSLDLSVTGEIL